jgi:hypothetical protein
VTLGVIEDDDDDLDQVIETTDDWQLLEPQEPEAYKRLIVPSCSRSRFYQPLRILAISHILIFILNIIRFDRFASITY